MADFDPFVNKVLLQLKPIHVPLNQDIWRIGNDIKLFKKAEHTSKIIGKKSLSIYYAQGPMTFI